MNDSLKKERVAIYPVFADTLPIIRYLKKYRTDLEIMELLSPFGCGGCGKDAGFLDNRELLGEKVVDVCETKLDSWDSLILLEHRANGYTGKQLVKMEYESIIRRAKLYNKRIVCGNRLFHDINEMLGDIVDISGTLTSPINDKKTFGKIYNYRQYTVFIGGIISEANSYEVFLSLYGELSKKYRVFAVSTAMNSDICGLVDFYGILHNSEYSEEEKVYLLNNVIHRHCQEMSADILLVHIDEPIVPLNDTNRRGFGIIPYMISQIIVPDYSICCLPYGYADAAFLEELSEGLVGKLGFEIDKWHLSNAILDYTIQTDIIAEPAIYLPMRDVLKKKNEVENIIPNIGNLTILADLFDVVDEITDNYEKEQIVDSLYESR